MEASLKTRSRACAISIFRPCAPGGGPCSGAKRQSLCRGTCCFASSRIGSRPNALVTSTRKRCASWTASLPETVTMVSVRFLRKQSGYDRLQPESTLVREWGGARQRVVVLDRGFAWNGKTYRSLSAVAFAMTGTRWSGPRFFGLRGRWTAFSHGAAPWRHCPSETCRPCSALSGAGRLAVVRWTQNTPDAADFASSAVLAFANAIPGGVAFNFALRRLTSETTVASARS